MAFKDEKHVGMVSNFTGNGIHCRGAYTYFQTPDPTGAIDPFTGTTKILDVATSVGLYSSNDNGTLYSEFVLDKGNLALSANNATLSNITVWGSNSILTQGRGDGRYVTPANLTAYLPSANFTYANIGGTIPTATNTTLGAIKVGSNLTISNGTLSASIPAAGFTNGDTLNGGSY